MDERYIAIKLTGLDHWLWFEEEKTSEEKGVFIGKTGWGKGGAFTEIEVNSDEIIGRINSDTLQYES